MTMTSNVVQQAQEHMAMIARGEEIDLPWAGFAFSSITAWSRSTHLSSWVDRLQEVEHPSRGQTRACGSWDRPAQASTKKEV
ncbi:hypothetical protein [Sinorhizobium meliloti]|uniref:hypothetical protein n=1 Tax=Rhizobium meliloti TaxID=382 RepID=UPI003F16377E